jgi:Sigma-70, region 4
MRQATAKGGFMKPIIRVGGSSSERYMTERDSQRKTRNKTITLMALYDSVETAPGKWRAYTLDEIGQRFGLTRERIRQVINMTGDPYQLILKRRREKQRLYEQAMAAARRNRTMTVYKRGSCKGKVRPEYAAYQAMLQRVFNPKNPNYSLYGGRGVTVHESWLGPHGYQQFFADRGPRPKRIHRRSKRAVYSLHRIDNSMIYSASTTKWATGKEQNNTAGGQRRRPTRARQV